MAIKINFGKQVTNPTCEICNTKTITIKFTTFEYYYCKQCKIEVLPTEQNGGITYKMKIHKPGFYSNVQISM